MIAIVICVSVVICFITLAVERCYKFKQRMEYKNYLLEHDLIESDDKTAEDVLNELQKELKEKENEKQR